MRQRSFAVSTRTSIGVSSGKVESQYLVGSRSASGHSISSHSSSCGAVSLPSRVAGRIRKSSPASSFEMGEAEFALEFLIVAFDAPAQFRGIDENFDRSVFGQGREPVFGRLALVFGPLDQQPFERLWGREL